MTEAKAPAKQKRIYVIQNAEGKVINILSEVANLDIAIITTTGEAEEGGVQAEVIRASVEKKAPKKELDQLMNMLNE